MFSNAVVNINITTIYSPSSPSEIQRLGISNLSTAVLFWDQLPANDSPTSMFQVCAFSLFMILIIYTPKGTLRCKERKCLSDTGKVIKHTGENMQTEQFCREPTPEQELLPVQDSVDTRATFTPDHDTENTGIKPCKVILRTTWSLG